MNWEKRLQEDISDYRPIPFWSWNAKLEIPQLLEQISEMKRAGMGGFFMHARSGLKTEYLGEEWFAAIDACIQEAKKQGMKAWAYDENGWPSGFAGRKLLEKEENLAHYLTFEKVDAYDPSALANYSLTQENRLIRLKQGETGESVYAVYDHVSPSVVDVLNKDVVKQFIALTHEEYARRYPEGLRGKITGFFTDEPQYYREATPYSPVLLSQYYSLYGEDLLDGLGALFLDCQDCFAFRWRYWKMVNDLFTESFAKQVYDWCEAHHCMLTGHAIEESALHTQMWCCAGVMPFYEYEHIPGCDWLGRNIDSEMTPRQVSSVAQQLGKPRVLTESFACTGWDVTAQELKKIVDWQYVNGVNMLCTHLTPYSLEGSRKFDHPAFFSPVNPWFEKFHVLADYVSKLGCMLTESREWVEVGVIHPMHSAYLTYDRTLDATSVRPLQQEFKRLIERLRVAQIPHHYLDETLLAKYGRVEGATLCLGACRYRTIVLPDMPQIDATTSGLLQEFLQNGGKLWLAGDRPCFQSGEPANLEFLRNTASFDDLKENIYWADETDTSVRSTYRVSANGDFLFAVNLGQEKQSITYHIAAPGVAMLNLEMGKTEPIAFETEKGGVRVLLLLEPGESVILLLGNYDSVGTSEEFARVTFSEPVMQDSTNNSFVIDRVRLSYNGVDYSDFMPVPYVSECLIKNGENREIWLEYDFVVQECPTSLWLECEHMNAREWRVNDHVVFPKLPGKLGKEFLSVDILPFTVIGENKVKVRLDYRQDLSVFKILQHRDEVSEGILNCLTLDTEIDSVFLHGDFSVKATKPLESTPEGLFAESSTLALTARVPAPMQDITQNGYPFFAGKMTFAFTAKAEGKGDLQLYLKGRFGAAHLCWNEYECDIVLSNRVTIPKEYVRSFNQITVTLYSGNRNLLGPFHWAKAEEPKAVFPKMFTMDGEWENGKNPLYRASYAFVPFGAEIKM